MKPLFNAVIISLALATPMAVSANPYCEKLAKQDLLPKKYQKRGPFHVDAVGGWIIGSDQMKNDFEVSDEAIALWREIKGTFESKGVKLTALIAPPRPLFAPDRADFAGYDAQNGQLLFSDYIAALNAAGIVAPDLSTLASDPQGQEYYFARDTHWTPKGAAVSAAMLAEAMTGRGADEILQEIVFTDSLDEAGSLSTVVEKTCGSRPESEIVAAPVYTDGTGQGSLLDDTTEPAIALVGTSFSDRYQRDTYQVAGAVAHAFNASVDNYSITGGGLAGAMEAFIASGAMDTGRYHTVVWETPYTAPLNNISGLRQILGGLHSTGDKTEIYSGAIERDWMAVKHGFSATDYRGLSIHIPGVNEGVLELELYSPDGQKNRVKLIKSPRVKPQDRTDIWNVSLAALPFDDVERLKIRLKDGAEKGSIYLIK